MKEGEIYKTMGGIGVAGITYLFGGWDQVLQILFLMIVIDYITGIVGAGMKGELSSKIGFKGIVKKVAIMIMVVIAVQLDKVMGQVNIFRYLVCFFYIANEGISILENFSKMGVPLPKFMVNLLKVMKDQADEGKVITGKDVM